MLCRFLGSVDLRGMAYEDGSVATGYGAHIALPLLRDAAERNPNMSRQQAQQLIEKCMEVLYYRDARSFPKVDNKLSEINSSYLSPSSTWTSGLILNNFSTIDHS